MSDKWDDAAFAKHWDETALQGNPSRAEQLSLLVSILSQHCNAGDTVLDLGIGSARVEEMFFQTRTDVNFVGVDFSEHMLSIAQSRLERLNISKGQCTLIQHDLSDFQGPKLMHNSFKNVISVQTLHHLYPKQQKEIYHAIYNVLQPGGLFLLLDRIDVDATNLGTVYASMWNWLEENAEIKSGWSPDYFLERLNEKDDYPARLEEQIKMLSEAGFSATCLHLNLNRGLFVGVKN
jgi:tRNA (cmo5U34)-methyltransferase